MVITISKDTGTKEIKEALDKLKKSKKKTTMSAYYGKLKGAFGDGLDYQKKLRDEWS